MSFSAKNLSLEAKAACKALRMTPREFEPLNAGRSSMADGPDVPEYPVLRIWNSKREIELTNHDLAYANRYLR